MHFLSVEPMLEPIDLSPWLGELDWLIVGGGSGVGNRSRPTHPDWVRDLRDQVRAAGGAFFLKQVGSNRALWPGVGKRHLRSLVETSRSVCASTVSDGGVCVLRSSARIGRYAELGTYLLHAARRER